MCLCNLNELQKEWGCRGGYGGVFELELQLQWRGRIFLVGEFKVVNSPRLLDSNRKKNGYGVREVPLQSESSHVNTNPISSLTSLPFLIFSSSSTVILSVSFPPEESQSMAITLSLPKLPHIAPNSASKLPVPSIPTKLDFSQNPKSPQSTFFIQSVRHLKPYTLPLTALTLPFFVDPQDALAAGGEFGILEGRSFALIHPIVMGALFVYTLWAGYLGWQWRRVRTVQNEINELKKQVVPAAVTPDGKPVEAPPSPTELKIQQLTEERKELIKGSFRDRHFNAGSILLGFGVLEAIGGGVNTWLRTGKLFPGPHLFAGAGITVLWALAAALVPAMQKGNETARNLHIALNAFNVLLFIWQIPTGIDIVFKVFEFTTWP